MSRFFVGQRVRIIGCTKLVNRHLIGSETVIVRRFLDWGWVCADEGVGLWWEEEYLQPILDSSAAPSEYSFTELMDRLRSGVVA